jgi:hypothetical protein
VSPVAKLNPRRHAAGKPFLHAFLTGWLAGARLTQIHQRAKIMEKVGFGGSSLNAATWPQDVVVDLRLPPYL